jgi:hypothetical protein
VGTVNYAYFARQSWVRYLPTQSSGTLDKFVLANPRGHFLIFTADHCTALCDGVVYDTWRISGLVRIEAAYEVIA